MYVFDLYQKNDGQVQSIGFSGRPILSEAEKKHWHKQMTEDARSDAENRDGVRQLAFDLSGELLISTDLREAIWTLFFEDASSLSQTPDQSYRRETALST